MYGFSKSLISTLPLLLLATIARAQTCRRLDEIPNQARVALQNAALRAFDQASSGDVNAMKADAIASLQADFKTIGAAVHDNQPVIVGARLQLRTIFLLDSGANSPREGRFFCGVYGASGPDQDAAEFDIPGIPMGQYGVVIDDIVGSQGRYAFTTIFQDANGWKLAGLYIRPGSAQGHDGMWYLAQARQYKSKGQDLNAWFYYVEAWELLAPVTFMENKLLADIAAEANSVRPVDVPIGGTPITFSAEGKTYKITEITVVSAERFDLLIRYSVQAGADGSAKVSGVEQLAAAYAAKYPELKDGFDRLFAVAVDPRGHETSAEIKLKQ